MKFLSTAIVLGILAAAPAVANADGPGDTYRRGGSWTHDGHRPRGGWDHRRGWDERDARPSFGGHRTSFDDLLQDGSRRGALSYAEVKGLREKHREYIRQEARYHADGRLTRNEREELREEYQDLYGDLQHELNDGERRRPGYRRGR